MEFSRYAIRWKRASLVDKVKELKKH